ncbi:MAG: undecaprenyl diphosphate synthase [Candidatus Omnitrophota bacterium]|jgi:undecaprenyl diphosphate synthase
MALDPQKIPQHVAIIMDGNGRWAKARGLMRIKGHEEGANSVRAAVRACRDHGVKYLTLYAFSVENWVRPEAEVRGLMVLLRKYLTENEYELHENEVRFRAIGRLADLPKNIQKEIRRVEASTLNHTKGMLTLALSYGGRAEITDAVRAIAEQVKDGSLEPSAIEESTIAGHLYAPDIPDPDLMIRTSGEMRISNFLLWQLSYSELYVTEKFWPEFREAEFVEALEVYQQRQRRFGDIG